MAKPHPKRRLRVVDFHAIGQTTKGKLYKVHAVAEDDKPINVELRSYAPLPLGEVAEYLLTREEHPNHGEVFVLHPPALEISIRISNLERRQADFEDRLAHLEGTAGEDAGDVPF